MRAPALRLLALAALPLCAAAVRDAFGQLRLETRLETNATSRAGARLPGGAGPPAFAARVGGASSAWAWSRVEAGTSTGERPSPRQGHAAVEVGRKIYILGGCLQEIRCYGDVWSFDADGLQWGQETPTGPAPPPRGGHTATLVGSAIFVYGGASSEETFGDAYKLDLVKREWSQGLTLGGGLTPGKRTGHAVATDDHGRIYVFGGYGSGGSFLSDLWMLRASEGAQRARHTRGVFEASWVQLQPSGPAPAARQGHSLTLLGRKLVLFGGYVAGGQVTNDLNLYDLDSQTWAPLPLDGVAPAPRQAHTAVRHGADIVLVGGCDITQEHTMCYGDAWSLSLRDMRWTPRTSDAITWFAREGHSATFSRGRMYVFGGCQLYRECYADLSVLDTFDACPDECGGHGECVPTGGESFCRCTAPGFTGHDCMEPLTCDQDCGAHGQCLQSGRCACENGWAGPDCAQELPCPTLLGRKCGGRGVCLESGLCKCLDGWNGTACGERVGTSLLEEWRAHQAVSACPHGCCGRGVCDEVLGQCRCAAGWYGEACTISGTVPHSRNATNDTISRRHSAGPAVLAATVRRRLLAEVGIKRAKARRKQRTVVSLEQRLSRAGSRKAAMAATAQLQLLRREVANLTKDAAAAEKKAAAYQERERRVRRQAVALLGTATSACSAQNPDLVESRRGFGSGPRQAAQEGSSPDDFGFDMDGVDHSPTLNCPDNCNFRGICQEDICYCQPGFYGEACENEKVSDKTTVSVPVTLAISGCVLAATALATCMCTGWLNPDTKSAEREMGYIV